MILLIFYEIMYVFRKKQIFNCHFFIKTQRITKIIKNRAENTIILHFFQSKKVKLIQHHANHL